MSLYQLEHLTRAYGRRTVLAIDHLEIEAGRMYALLGPNGAGKTTLLNLLAFLDEPTTGSLRFCGKPVGSDRAERLALRRQVVLVDQHPIMFSTSVAANIEFGLKIRKIDRTARQRAVQAALETVGLERYRAARAHELSGGETQRLALARALALAPTVLLCDEPTASVDTENQAKIAALLRRINTEQGTTIVFTSHDRLQAASLAERTVVLENGRLTATTYETTTPAPWTRPLSRPGWFSTARPSPDRAARGVATGQPGRVAIDPTRIRLRTGARPSPPNARAGWCCSWPRARRSASPWISACWWLYSSTPSGIVKSGRPWATPCPSVLHRRPSASPCRRSEPRPCPARVPGEPHQTTSRVEI